MAQTTINFRVDNDLKEEFSKLFDFDDFQRDLIIESIKRVFSKK